MKMMQEEDGMSMMMDDDMKHMNQTIPFCRHGGMIMYVPCGFSRVTPPFSS
jgi:hypothetical protein